MKGLMNNLDILKQLMNDVLGLNESSATWTAETPLLGSLPELDSLAVVQLITGMEARFSFHIDDDEINAEVFATLGSLAHFVAQKTPAISPAAS